MITSGPVHHSLATRGRRLRRARHAPQGPGWLHGVWLCAVLLAAPALAQAAPPLVTVCWGYGCSQQQRVVLGESDWLEITELFANVPDAATERDRIARAVALFEQATGRVTGTAEDRGGNIAGAGQPYQMDCIDESRNTDEYLRVLARQGMLRWHEVRGRERRAPWLFDRHWTAVIRVRQDGVRWAVDSWFLDNGKRPYIQRLAEWFDKADLPSNPDAAEAGARGTYIDEVAARTPTTPRTGSR